jgi:hypothetical protein
MKFKIENVAEKRSARIAKKLLNDYDLIDFENNQLEIEKEIYQISLSCANIFFYFHNDVDYEQIKSELISNIKIFINPKINISKNSIQELLANLIKFYTIKKLEKYNIIFI